MKKILTLMGLMLIVACSVMVVVSCENTDWGEGDGDPSLLEYKLSEDGTFYIVAGIGDYVGTHLVIPEEYKGLPVREIKSWVFSGSYNNIGDDRLLELDTPWLKSITISDNIAKLEDYSFSNSNIEQVNIESGVSEIEVKAFSSMKNLKKINVSKDNQNYMSKNGVLYSKDGIKLIRYPGAKKRKSFTLSSEITEIGPHAFDGAVNLKRVKIGNNVTQIGQFAFFNAGIKRISIPDSVKILGAEAFEACKSLKKVKLGSGLTEIAQATFGNCHKLVKIVMPKNIKAIRAMALWCGENAKIFYEGTEAEWNEILLDTKVDGTLSETWEAPVFLDDVQIYYYSKQRTKKGGNYWRYIFGVPVIWKN